jgi:hypothetical protein
MPDFSITPAVVKRIADIWGRHGEQLNEEITEAFPDNPDKAFVVAIGFAVGKHVDLIQRSRGASKHGQRH